MNEHEQAVQFARSLRDEIAREVTRALGLDSQEPPAFMAQVALALSQGHVIFDVDAQVEREDAARIESAILRAQGNELIRSAGWLCMFPEGIILAMDELWVDPKAEHAMEMIQLGLSLILITGKGAGVISLRVDASEAYENAGWVVLDRRHLSKDVRTGLAFRWPEEEEVTGFWGKKDDRVAG